MAHRQAPFMRIRMKAKRSKKASAIESALGITKIKLGKKVKVVDIEKDPDIVIYDGDAFMDGLKALMKGIS